MKLFMRFFFSLFLLFSYWNKLKTESQNSETGDKVPNNNVSESEKDEIYLEFAEYDLNKDGLIDAEEVVLALKNMKKSDFVNFFVRVDLDSSGTISISEYMAFIESN